MQVWDIGGQSIGGRMLDKYIYGSNVSNDIKINCFYYFYIMSSVQPNNVFKNVSNGFCSYWLDYQYI